MTLTIIVAVIITALVTAMSLVAAESSQRTGAISKMDQAFLAAEAGAQRVVWYCKTYQLSTVTSPLQGTVNGFTYTTSWQQVSGLTMSITSVAISGNVSYTLSLQVSPQDTGIPALQSVSDFDNKNIDVNGDVIVGGNYTNGGNGSLAGDLDYYGSASHTTDVTGDVTKPTTPATTINFTTLGTTLVTAAGQTYTGNQSNRTFDFTALPGTNKVIYVNGDVSNPTFIGSGTLYASGKISSGGFGTATSPVHLVAKGTITTSNNVTIYGGIYTGADWERGKFDLTGMVYTAGVVKTNNGQSTLTQAMTPWFDPRLPPPGTPAITPTTVARFSGPQP